MNSLTVFIIDSNKHNSDISKTIESVSGISTEIYTIPEYKDYLSFPIETTWFGFLFDNETFSDGLQEAIKTFLTFKNLDVLIFYKKTYENGDFKIYKCPRIFKRGIELDSDYIIPKVYVGINYEIILNDWILQH